MTVLSMTLLNRTSAALKIYCRTVLPEMRATSDVDDMRGPAIEEWLVALVAPGDVTLNMLGRAKKVMID